MRLLEAPRELLGTAQALTSFAICLVPNQRLRYVQGRPILRSTAPMDAWPCLARCFTSVF
jgi:hypothetical protein